MNEPRTNYPQREKHPGILLSAVLIWLLVFSLVAWPWIDEFETLEYPFSFFVFINAGIWWIVLLWGIYNIHFQLWALFIPPKSNTTANPIKPPVAILYTTCDDFNPEACLSCIRQDYFNTRVLICDDSEESKYQAEIEDFCSKNPKARHITRPNRRGYKAGNLNHVIEHKVHEPWVLLVDADQILPANYLSDLVQNIPAESTSIAFIQGAHQASLKDFHSSPFQAALAPEVSLFYTRDLSARQRYGFVPLLGHGALVQKQAWKAVDKFPELVSEDFAFSLRAVSKSLRGIYAEQVISYEAYPYDFGGFMIRLLKYAGGTAELFRKELGNYLKGDATAVEKWDFAMQIFWYVLTPLIVLNSFLGSYVLSQLYNKYFVSLNPALPYLYTFLFLTFLAVNISVTGGLKKSILFYFWSTAIYTASLPLAGLAFIKHLFVSPNFKRTPKNSMAAPLHRGESFFMIFLGILSLLAATFWYSPFSFVLYSHGTAYLFYPLFGNLSSRSGWGGIARILVNIPGILMIAALYAMWIYGRF